MKGGGIGSMLRSIRLRLHLWIRQLHACKRDVRDLIPRFTCNLPIMRMRLWSLASSLLGLILSSIYSHWDTYMKSKEIPGSSPAQRLNTGLLEPMHTPPQPLKSAHSHTWKPTSLNKRATASALALYDRSLHTTYTVYLYSFSSYYHEPLLGGFV